MAIELAMGLNRGKLTVHFLKAKYAHATKSLEQERLVYLFPNILKNLQFLEYIKFEAILWKSDILLITALGKFDLKIFLHPRDT